jgi:type 2 lantibiotic biosynthesis protein LanM
MDRLKRIGGFSGWGGVVYTLTHLAVLWGRSDLLTTAEKLAEEIPPLLPEDHDFDVISGAAGAIGALLCLYRVRPSARILEIATLCGDRLLQAAQPMAKGVGWTATAGAPPLAGFSHGAAGIAWALHQLAQATSQERFRQAAREAVAYEQTLFRPEAGNWLDVRPLAGDSPAFMTAWCHGAPGIGLARLASLAYQDTPAIRADIETALQTTLREGFGGNHSLCHGDLGNLELILQAAKLLDGSWAEPANRQAAVILANIQQHGARCGIAMAVETPGLMTGLAGIGYGLLRLAAPDKLPSVLMLDPPRR